MIILKNCNAFVGDSKKAFQEKHIYIDKNEFSKIDSEFKSNGQEQIIDLKGLFVTPGIIEPHCQIGLLEHGVGWAGSDENEDQEPIQDHCHVIDGINMHDHSFNDFRKSGITSVGIFPGNNCIVGGYGSALKCKGKIVDEAIIRSDIGLKVALGGTVKAHFAEKKKAPLTRMGIMAILNQFIIDSKHNSTNDKVISGELPLYVNCERLDDIYSAIRFGEKNNLEIRLIGLADFEDAKKVLLNKNIHYALGPIMHYATQKETRNRDKYRCIESPFMEIGSLTTSHPSINGRYVALQASIMRQNGLEETAVLKSLTINPAEFLGIEDKVGSIEVGKDADLVIWDKHPLELTSKVLATMIDGEFVYKGGDLSW